MLSRLWSAATASGPSVLLEPSVLLKAAAAGADGGDTPQPGPGGGAYGA